MNDHRLSRRAALQSLAVGVVASSVAKAAGTVDAGTPALPPAFAGAHTVVPLPFPAGKLTGLSEKLITSHHDNNYAAAVKNLNRVELELSHLPPDAPGFLVSGLREKELTFRNSKTLHEAYFGNLGGDGKRSGTIERALATTWGSTATFEAHFRATGLALGGGSGWVVLALELDTGALRTVAAGNHTQALATAVPLLVMDLYEHSYQLDYGAAHAKYVDAFFTNISWDEVNRRLERAQRASAAWRT
jgi:Fe-Mn family superoxide dismutase